MWSLWAICRIVSVVSFRNRTAMTSLSGFAFRLLLQIPFFPPQTLEFFANDSLAFRSRCLDLQYDNSAIQTLGEGHLKPRKRG